MTNSFRILTTFRTKRDPVDLVDQINSILGHAAASNAAWLGARLDGPTAAHIGAVDIDDLTDEAFDRLRARAEMMGEDAAAGLARDPSAQATVSQYQAWVNARRQQALGISHYVWRTRDDARVRPGHRKHDDQVFAWDKEVPHGHPKHDTGHGHRHYLGQGHSRTGHPLGRGAE